MFREPYKTLVCRQESNLEGSEFNFTDTSFLDSCRTIIKKSEGDSI